MSTPHSASLATRGQAPASSKLRRTFFRELAHAGLPRDGGVRPVVSDDDLALLPPPARRFLRFARVVGRSRDYSFCARWNGRFRMAPDKPWMAAEAWQYDTSSEIARIFHMRLRLGHVVPTYVRDTYLRGRGHMSGRIFDRFSIVDDRSEAVTIGELVTYLNDAITFAPSMLLVPGTVWAPVDDRAFDVSITDCGHTVTGRTFVDEAGRMTDFATTDRFGEDPANRAAGLVRTRWSTPIDGWTFVGGRARPTAFRAVWHFPSGDFCYGEIAAAKMDIAFDVPPGPPIAAAE